MRFKTSKLSETRLNQISAFYQSFGYFVAAESTAEGINQTLRATADGICFDRKGYELSEKDASETHFFPHILEDYPELKSLLAPKPIQNILENTLGQNFLYLGSDLSIFHSEEVQPWHRDWITELPVLKVAYYLLPNAEIGGELRVIPGTHDINCKANQVLSRGMAWPAQPEHDGGLNEGNVLPQSIGYGTQIPNADLRYLENGLASQIIADETSLCYLPHEAIKTTDTQSFVCFDPRLIHSGTWSLPSERRFLFSTLYGANPFEDYPGKKNNSWECCQELAGQLLELLILDRMLHGVDTVYHPTNKVPPFSKSHLIDFGFDGQTYFLKNQDHEYKTTHLNRSGVTVNSQMERQDTLAALCRLNASYY